VLQQTLFDEQWKTYFFLKCNQFFCSETRSSKLFSVFYL
jgi:hypothetical protein